MTRNSLIATTLLLALLFAAACQEQSEPVQVADKTGKASANLHGSHDGSTAAELEIDADPHAGHDHASEAAEEADPHAGHDHASEPTEEADSHAGHDHASAEGAAPDDTRGAEGESGTISLSPEQISELGISHAPAGPGTLGRELALTGEIAINEDKVTHVSPRISGIVSKVYRRLGDHIQAGAPLLELDSIELAQVKSEYLALLSRVELSRQTLEREEMLLGKGISAEQDYLAAKQALEELLIAKRSTEQMLSAMGLGDRQISNLATDSDPSLTSYTLYAPVGGEIIEKHASLGEVVDSSTEVFTIGDLSTVWVRLNVYQPDFLDVSEGMEVLIDAGHGVEPISCSIDYIEPLIGEQTRTAVARVVLLRSSRVLRPGLFVTGYLEIGGDRVELVVPRSAVVDLDEDKLVFVRGAAGFEPRLIGIGRQTAASIEVHSGIEAGEEIVVSGAFQLKAELLKGTFDPHAGHAH